MEFTGHARQPPGEPVVIYVFWGHMEQAVKPSRLKYAGAQVMGGVEFVKGQKDPAGHTLHTRFVEAEHVVVI